MYSDGNGNNVEVILGEQVAVVLVEDKQIGKIGLKTNPCHNEHCYLDLEFECYDLIHSKFIFDTLWKKIKKPLQVMLSSSEMDIISFLSAAGFSCKRKCYEVEASIEDYIGGEVEYQVFCAKEGQGIYEQCREMMLERYISTHKVISPWTGTKDDFYSALPKIVYYDMVHGKVSNFAFVEEDEIAYVYGTDKKGFGIFAEALLTKLFRQFEVITFEADDCDEYAMELKALFVNQFGESFDTYILSE